MSFGQVIDKRFTLVSVTVATTTSIRLYILDLTVVEELIIM